MTPELVHAILWPTVVVVSLVLFRQPISGVLDRLTHFRIKTPDGREIEITAREAVSITQQLLDEADRLIEDIGPAEQQLLLRIVNASGPLTVDQLFDGKFRREDEQGRPTEQLERLRKLRDRQLIRPVKSGQFKADKELEIKPFGRILLKLRPEKLLGKKPT